MRSFAVAAIFVLSFFCAPLLFATLSGFLSFHRWHNLYPLLIFLLLITPRMSLLVCINIHTHSVCICVRGHFSLRRSCVCVSKWLPVSPFSYFLWIFRFVIFSLLRAFQPPHLLCYVCSLNTSTLLMLFSFPPGFLSFCFVCFYVFLKESHIVFPVFGDFLRSYYTFNGVFCTALSFVIKEVEVKLHLSDKFIQLSGYSASLCDDMYAYW